MEHLQFLFYKNIKITQGDFEPEVAAAAEEEEEIIQPVILILRVQS